MKIVNKEYLGIKSVYDIGISSLTGTNNFVLENGLIASNCFNKAHSVSYSVLTYVSAYMKTHYPVEFFTALMSTRSKTLQPKTWATKAPEYISEAKKFNVEIYPPSVNNSGYEFTINDGEIYFGLNAIRDVGKTAAKAIIRARQKTPFKDIKDFLNRVNLQKVNTKTFEALVKAGAFDKMGYCRKSLVENISNIYAYIRDIDDYSQRKLDVIERDQHNRRVEPLIERRNFLRKEIKKIQARLDKNKQKEADLDNLHIYSEELEPLEEQQLKRLPALKPKEMPTFPELLRNHYIELDMKTILDQARYIGCYIGGHPMHLLNVKKDDINTLEQGNYAEIAGVILSLKEITTRKGKKMAFFDIDDATGNAEVVIFPNLWQKVAKLKLKDTDIVRCKVKVEKTDPEIKLILNSIDKYRDQNEVDT
jgi:DNA polymerase III subunit alpha